MSLFDDISHAIGTDGSGGGAVVEIGKALGTGDSTTGLLNNPGVKEAAAIAAIAYGVPAGIEYFGAGAAGAGAGSGFSLAASDAAFTSAVSSSGASAGLFSGLGSTIVSGVNTAGQVIGGLGAIKSLAGNSGVKSVGAVPYGYSQPLGVGYIAPGTVKTVSPGNEAGSAATGAVSVKSKDSTLTVLASALTVAAILYQFFGKKK